MSNINTKTIQNPTLNYNGGSSNGKIVPNQDGFDIIFDKFNKEIIKEQDSVFNITIGQCEMPLSS